MTTPDTDSSPIHRIPFQPRQPFRLTHLCWYLTVLAAAFLLALLQPVAWAQAPAQIDPPGRVARLNLAEGAVSFAPGDNGAPANAANWTPAVLNRPLTSGDRLWTGPQSRSELYVGSTAVRMNDQTSLDFLALDDNVTQLRLAQGTIKLRVRNLYEGQRLEVDTPNLAFVVSEPGDYRLDVDPASNTTRVIAQSGSGVIYGDDARSVTLGSQQQANFTGTQLVPAGPGAAQQDSFDTWAANRDRLEDQSVSARYVPRETVGYQQLDAYGTWSQDPAYGAVWIPREVPVQWAPYRDGHWAWVSPWGWTWVDDAPWGFAPFHYGRWAQIGPRWAWVPGRLAPRPVYAPALVAFVGGSSGNVSWNISIGGAARPSVGWFPLAPGEAYRPVYRASPRYITQVNHNVVVNNTVNVTNIYRYQRQPGAVTAVSRDDFMRGRPVRSQQHALSRADLDRAQIVADRSAIPQRPSRQDLREDARERTRPVAAGALPPPAVVARPVVSSRDDRRDDHRDSRRDTSRQEESIGQRALREQAQTDAQNRAAAAETRAAANRSAAEQAQRAQQQAQREQQHQQRELARQQDQLRRQQGEESIGQRALREQAQADAQNRAAAAETRVAANRSAAEQAQRTQQQAQREQQHQQRELARQQDQLRRQQGEESIGQRALREQAQAERENARQQQAAQRQQQQQQQQQRAQQEQQRQVQAQEQQQRRQQQLQQQQSQRDATPDRPPRQADATNPRGQRGEGGPGRNREQ